MALLLTCGCVCQGDALEGAPYPALFHPHWEKPEPVPAVLGLTLSFAAEVRPDVIDAYYVVRSTSEKHFRVLNKVIPDSDFDPHEVHIDFDGTGLVLGKHTRPQPYGSYCNNYSPGVTPLEPWGTVSERFQVPLPAVVNNWIRKSWLVRQSASPIRFTPTRAWQTRRITLTIGVLVESSDPDGLEEMTLSNTVFLPESIEVLDDEGRAWLEPKLSGIDLRARRLADRLLWSEPPTDPR